MFILLDGIEIKIPRTRIQTDNLIGSSCNTMLFR